MANKLDYHHSVNYSQADPMKVLAQKQGLATVKNMPDGFSEVEGTRGESAYVFKMGNQWGAFVQEGLGTKSLVAQAVYEKTGESYFAAIAQDTVACIINDLISVGATPVVLNAYWSSSSYEWLTNEKLAADFINGWRTACDKAKVTWGGGETQSLPDVIVDGALELAGSAFGVIKSERRLINGARIQPGDAIVLIESSGPHANGISLIRTMAAGLADGYQTKITDKQTLAEGVLAATHIYAELVLALQAADLDLHYLSNITGHGWRKLMRAQAHFTYLITEVPDPPDVFGFIADKTQNNTKEMYGNYNMGAGFAVYLPANQADRVVEIAEKCGLKAWLAGMVEAGPKRVLIKPLDITFEADSLEVR